MFRTLLMLVIPLSIILNAGAEVIKNPIDQKQYRYLVLDNKLKVLLISDKETDKSAASLDVFVGNGSDPEEWQGLAHFLEHMLFLGTEKYPEAGEYQEFIKNNGGGNNAYTSYNHTNYYFNIAPDYFEPALDRFSRFFIDPTFDAVYVDRERSIVHSEYQARKKDENRRLWDAEKQWFNKDHPYSRFSVGSIHTLRDREESSARNKLIEFYKVHYSASIMTLAVLSNLSLDAQEQMIRQKFADIPNHNIAVQQFQQPLMNDVLSPARLQTIPDKQQNSVRFLFPVPSTYLEYKSKPFAYISNLLGHEGEGSLFSVLKAHGWAEGLSAGAGFMDQVQGEFGVRIQLTKSGLTHIDDIGELLFAYIELIKSQGVEQWRFEEQRDISNVEFRFAQENSPGKLVQSLSSRMHNYAPEDILQGPYMIETFDPDRIKELLDYLNVDNVNYHLTSKNVEANEKTNYYDVDFKLDKIPELSIKQWRQPSGFKQLSLPEPNPFIPQRLELLTSSSDLANSKNPGKPSEVDVEGNLKLWHLQNDEFATPRASFYFNVMSPIANNNIENVVLLELLVNLVNNQLNKTVYPAALASVNYSLYRHGRGISGRINGFEDKQSELLGLLVAALAKPEFDQDAFEIIKARMVRGLKNVALDLPSSQVVHEIYRLLMEPYWTEAEKLAALEEIQLDDVKRFLPKFFDKVKVNVLSHGDVSESIASKRVGILSQLFTDSEFVSDVKKPGVRKLQEGQQYIRTLDIDHTDAALAVYFQAEYDTLNERARSSLLKALLETDFYNDLRITNRVGYIVQSGSLTIDDNPGLLLSVQSATHSPVEINTLYENFIAEFKNILGTMSEGHFDQVKKGLIARILQQDKNLGEKTQRFWRELDRNEFAFDYQQNFADAVDILSLEQMQQYYARLVLDRGAELTVQTAGSHEGENSQLIDLSGFIETGETTQFRAYQ